MVAMERRGNVFDGGGKVFLLNNPTLSPFPNKHLSKICHRIKSGSNGLNFQAFSYQFNNSSGEVAYSSLCRSCNLKNETIDHCLFECNMVTSAQFDLHYKSLKCLRHPKISPSAKGLATYT